MNQIKFRAWDGEKLSEPFSLGHLLINYNSEYADGRSDISRFNFDGEATRPILEQFTGLLDKNGKEIWEGDIVKQTTASGTDPHIRPVVFITGTFGAGRPFDFHNMVTGIVEVIGNIHENADLLEKAA